MGKYIEPTNKTFMLLAKAALQLGEVRDASGSFDSVSSAAPAAKISPELNRK